MHIIYFWHPVRIYPFPCMEELIHWVSFLCFQSINVNPGTTVELKKKKKCITHGGEEG